MPKKKKRPSAPKGHQKAAIEAIVQLCKTTFAAKDIRKWLRSIKWARISTHLSSMNRKGRVKQLGDGSYSRA